MITIYDVAKKANVSIATVSYALNNKNSVSEKTRKRIQEIAEELGYVPNSLAKGLLSRKTNIMGVIIPDISHHYTAALMKQLQHYARLNDYFLLIGSNYQEFNSAREILDAFIAKKVDALIISPALLMLEGEGAYQDVLLRIQRSGIPYLFINDHLPDFEGSFLAPDVEAGQYKLTCYLLEQGHTQISFLGGEQTDSNTLRRYNGWRKAMQEYGLDVSSMARVQGGYDFQDGYEAGQLLVTQNQLPDAIMGINDVFAMGVYKALRQQGIKVPEDVSLVGFDDLMMPTLEDLALTTMRIPLDELAKESIEQLGKTGTDQNPAFQQLLEPELIIRQSVKKR